ncbi:hypothetical protein PENTCL1PPCAC_8074 [Pristionchus entomophagus]|uniref:Glutathione S-transferase n=1 Tax=Pristionchus entomophagus TaxID=358040 RepID=A0AAV5T041_9BILA|nr:hypothetical protein PENTCL1PPCAC_8074 [Pristionchus entomophagus]
MPQYKLTYFDLRGRGEPIRMMFGIAGVPLEDNRLQMQIEEWPGMKKNFPFEALPVLEVDGVQVAQTLAILRYIARETGYAGSDNLTAALADSLCDQYADFITAFSPWHFVNSGYAPGDEPALYESTYLPAKAKNFAFFEAALEKSTTGWYANTPELTHVDVCIAAGLEMLKSLDKNSEKLFEGFPKMEEHYKKYEIISYCISDMPHYKLTYFDLRAKGEPIRMMFAIAGVPLEETRVTEEEWLEIKKNFPFEALPVLEVDGVQVAQTLAILRYIARETGFACSDNLTAALADALCGQYEDFFAAFYPWLAVNAGYIPGDEVSPALYESTYLPAKAKNFPFFEAALEKSSTGWYANTPEQTQVDCHIAAGLEMLKSLDKNSDKLFEGFPKMEAHYKKFFAHPKLQKYLEERPDAAGEPIRMMFAIAGIPLEETRVQMDKWLDIKKSTTYSSLPLRCSTPVAQTLAILRYIARDTGYAGSDNLTAAQADSLADQYADFYSAFRPWHLVNAGYAPVFTEYLQDALYESIYLPAKAKHFPYFEAALQKSTTGWYANTPELTHADVYISTGLEWLRRLDKNAEKLFDGLPLIEANYKKFFAHPKLQNGEPCRMMFAIAGIKYEDKRIQLDEMAELKPQTPFGCLPMLEVDGVKLAQTLAILRYIARETGYGGPDNLSAAIGDALADQYADFVTSLQNWLVVTAGYVQADEDALYQSLYAPAKAKNFPFFEAALKKSTTGWYANTPELTHVDVFIAASLEWLIRLDKNGDKLFEGYPLMEAHYKKFFALPAIEKHVAERPAARY